MSTSTIIPQDMPAPGGLARVARFALRYAIVGILIALVATAATLYPGFLSAQNLQNLLSQNAPVGIVAVGMTFVVIAGGFDLSVGALYATAATLYASLAPGLPLIMAAVVTLAAGVTGGAINGFVVTRLRVNTFVATLGTASIFSGAAFLYSHSSPFVVNDPSFAKLGQGDLLGMPIAALLLIGAVTVGGFVLQRTVYGQVVYAIGGNREAAHLVGLRVDLVRASTYAIVGACAAAAGMIIASRLGVGQADIGATVALDAIATVVIGGTSLLGGEGAMWRTAVGLLILATLTNVFDALALDTNLQLILKGMIVIASVALDSLTRRLH